VLLLKKINEQHSFTSLPSRKENITFEQTSADWKKRC